MRHTRSHGNGTYSVRPARVRALALIVFIFAAFGIAAATHADPAAATTPSYEFVNDETAAGDLDLPYQDNTDYEDDALGTTCERELINECAYGPDVYVYTCDGVRPE